LVTINDIIKLWPYLCEFIDKFKVKKVEKIQIILGDINKRQKLFAIFKSLSDYLTPLSILKIKLESGDANSHQIYKLVNEKLLALQNSQDIRS